MSVIDLSRASFTPLSRAPAWPQRAAVAGVRLTIKPVSSAGSQLRVVIGAKAQVALGALEGERVTLNFSAPDADRVLVLISKASDRRSGSTLRRRNDSPSLCVQFTAAKAYIAKITVEEAVWCAHPDGGLVLELTGAAALAVWRFKVTADLVANAVRERIAAHLAEAAR